MDPIMLGKINKVNESLNDIALQKADKDEIFTMANMGQDIREAMTGGSVAVVGDNAVIETNIVNGNVTEKKTNFFTQGKNLLNLNKITSGYKLASDGKTLLVSATNAITEYISCADYTNLYLHRFEQANRNANYLSGTYYYYDSAYNFLSLESVISSSTNKYSIVPVNAEYVRVVYTLTTGYDLMLISGTDANAIPFEAFSYSLNYVAKSDSKINLVDKTKMYTGYSMSASGASVSAGYTVTGFIPIKSGKTYYIERFRNLLVYDSVINVKADSLISVETREYVFTATQDGYIRFSVNDTYKDNAFMCEVKGTLLNFGDSVADGDGNNDRSYSHMIAQNRGFSVVDYALGGATLGWLDNQTFPYQNIIKQVEDAVASSVNPTLILIDGGTNDSTTGIVLGSKTNSFSTIKTDYNITTTLGATEYIISQLKTKYPTAKIVFVKTHIMGSKPVALIDIENAIHDVCKKWSVAVADVMQESGLNTNLSVHEQYTNNADKTHPSELGYQLFYLPIIDKKVAQVLGS